MTSSTIVHVAHVSHSYGATRALQDVSFDVQQGSFWALLGPNGSGKTTLFRLLCTLLPLQEGTVQIAGCDLRTQQSAVRQQIAVTFQSPALDGRLTVLENLHCHAALYGISRSDLKQRLPELLTRLQLLELSHSETAKLSGGQRRRVELAKCLLHSPRLILLDEPTTGLDVRARAEFWSILREQRSMSGATIIVATHLLEEAEQCDHLLMLNHGSVAAEGSPDSLKQQIEGERLTVRCRDVVQTEAVLIELLGQPVRRIGQDLVYQSSDCAARIPEVLGRCGSAVLSVEVSRPTLEDVFLSLTGTSLQQESVGT